MLGQNHIYMMSIRYFWRENHQIYTHSRTQYILYILYIYIVHRVLEYFYMMSIRYFWQGNHQIYTQPYTVYIVHTVL